MEQEFSTGAIWTYSLRYCEQAWWFRCCEIPCPGGVTAEVWTSSREKTTENARHKFWDKKFQSYSELVFTEQA